MEDEKDKKIAGLEEKNTKLEEQNKALRKKNLELTKRVESYEKFMGVK